MFTALAKGPSTGEGSRRNNPFGVSQIAKGPPERAWAGEEVPHVPLGKARCPAGRRRGVMGLGAAGTGLGLDWLFHTSTCGCLSCSRSTQTPSVAHCAW